MTGDREQIELMLSAYLDDELTRDERAEVEALLASDAGARRLLDDLRATVDGVRALPRAKVSEEFRDALRSHLERRALLGGEAPRRMPRVHGPSTLGRRMAAAAVIALAGLAGYITYSFTREPGHPPEYYAFKDKGEAKREVNKQFAPRSPTAPPTEVKPDSDLTAAAQQTRKQGDDADLGGAGLAGAPADKPASTPPPAPSRATACTDGILDAEDGSGATPSALPNGITAEPRSPEALARADEAVVPESSRYGRQFGDALMMATKSGPAPPIEAAPMRKVVVAKDQTHIVDLHCGTWGLAPDRLAGGSKPTAGPLPVLGPDLLDQVTTAPFLVQIARAPAAGDVYIFQSPVRTRPAASRPASAPATTRAASQPEW